MHNQFLQLAACFAILARHGQSFKRHDGGMKDQSAGGGVGYQGFS
jgi:hypothetical protein